MEGTTIHLTTFNGTTMRVTLKHGKMVVLECGPREDLDLFIACYLMSVSGSQYFHASMVEDKVSLASTSIEANDLDKTTSFTVRMLQPWPYNHKLG